MDFYFLNTKNGTIIITDSVIFEYPNNKNKDCEDDKDDKRKKNTPIVNKYSNAQEILNTVNSIRKLKKIAKGKYQNRVKINEPCRPCLPDILPTWDDLNKSNKKLDDNLNKSNKELDDDLKKKYKKIYDF